MERARILVVDDKENLLRLFEKMLGESYEVTTAPDGARALALIAAQLFGKSPRMREVYDLLRHAAELDITVLIRGDSGTGKELAARAIHHESARRERRFVAVNCGALPGELVESELFGHARGAFTGAA